MACVRNVEGAVRRDPCGLREKYFRIDRGPAVAGGNGTATRDGFDRAGAEGLGW